MADSVRIEVSDALQAGAADGRLLLVGQNEGPASWGLPPALTQTMERLAANGVFTGKLGQLEAVPTHGLLPYPYVLVAGLGPDADAAVDAWRDAGVHAARAAGKLRLEHLALEPAGLSNGTLSTMEQRLAAFAEGVALGRYRMKTYRNIPADDSSESRAPGRVTLVLPAGADESAAERLRERVQAGLVLADATNYARDLTNLPSNLFVPETMAQEAVRLAQKHGFGCTVLDERAIEEQGMLGLHHVGKGSVHPPRMIILQYVGAPDSAERVGLVGKGITFDTGGISIKPASGMEEMISDMGGAAVVLAVMDALGRLRPRVNVTAVIPAAENMPSGGAFKPGDVIPTLSGRTVEVLNTDAEGRIVLADGITYAKRLGATRIIDVATLTGAILISLGDVATGALTNDEPFLQQLLAAAKRSGEKVWPLPAYREYWEMLDSDVADVRNQTGANKWAGAITAGLFAGVFAEETPWVHFDTGGTAWLWNERGTEPKGGTGAMVRTLLHYLCDGL